MDDTLDAAFWLPTQILNDDDAVITDGGCPAAFDNVIGNSTDSSPLNVIDSCNSSSLSGSEPNFGSRNLADGPFSSDLCIPCDDLAELEWLSNFVEESFSSEDLQKLQLISGMKPRPDQAAFETRQFQPDPTRINNNPNGNNNSIFNPEVSVPAKARSKRSRAAPCNWTSRLLLLSSTPEQSDVVVSAAEAASPLPPPSSTGKKTVKSAPKKKESQEGSGGGPITGSQGAFAATMSEGDRHRQQLQSISASLASLTRETGPKVVKGDPKSDGQKATHVEHHLYDAFLFGVSDSALKFTHILYNLSSAGRKHTLYVRACTNQLVKISVSSVSCSVDSKDRRPQQWQQPKLLLFFNPGNIGVYNLQ